MMKLSECLNEVPPTPRLKKPGRVSPDAPRKTPDRGQGHRWSSRRGRRRPPPDFGAKKSMLGDLPALDKKKKRRKKKKKSTKKELEAFMSLELEVPLQQLHAKNAAAGERQRRLGYINDGKTVSSPTGKSMEDGRVPLAPVLLHQQPLDAGPRVSSKFPLKDKVSYERETIRVWLKTRGSVCVLVGIVIGGREPDTQLRNGMRALSSTKDDVAAADPFDAMGEIEDKAGRRRRPRGTMAALASLYLSRC